MESLNYGWHVRVDAVEAWPAGLLPSSSLVSSVSPNWSNQFARRQICNDIPSSLWRSHLKLEHYACRCFSEDSSEDWTTLPSRKRKNCNTSTPSRCIYPACCAYVKTEANTTSVALGWRVEVHLVSPPPNSLYVAPKTSKLSWSEPSMKGTEDRKYAASSSPTNFDGDSYPSPGTWRS